MTTSTTDLVLRYSRARHANDLLVLAYIARCAQASESGFTATISLREIATQARVSQNTVRRCLASLEALGELSVQCGSGAGRYSTYRLNLLDGLVGDGADEPPAALSVVLPDNGADEQPATEQAATTGAAAQQRKWTPPNWIEWQIQAAALDEVKPLEISPVFPDSDLQRAGRCLFEMRMLVDGEEVFQVRTTRWTEAIQAHVARLARAAEQRDDGWSS